MSTFFTQAQGLTRSAAVSRRRSLLSYKRSLRDGKLIAASNQEPQGSAAKLWLVAKELHNPRAFDSRLLPSNTAKRQLQTAEGPLQSASMKKFEQQPILSAAFGAAHAPQPRDHGSSE